MRPRANADNGLKPANNLRLVPVSTGPPAKFWPTFGTVYFWIIQYFLWLKFYCRKMFLIFNFFFFFILILNWVVIRFKHLTFYSQYKIFASSVRAINFIALQKIPLNKKTQRSGGKKYQSSILIFIFSINFNCPNDNINCVIKKLQKFNHFIYV